MTVAVLGLGLLGSEIALRLHGQGIGVLGWNRGAQGAEAARVRGIAVRGEPAEAILEAETVLLVLSDAEAIADTLARPGVPEALAARRLIQMGTIAPAESRALAERAAALGADYLEAPVLGSLPEARAGRLIIMAGGEPAAFDRALPLLRELGEAPRLIGPVGQGAAMKLAMNQLIAGLTASFALSLGLVQREGLEVEDFMELLRTSALYAPTFDKKLSKYLARDYSGANFPLKHLLKDVRLFRRVAEAQGLDAELLVAIERLGAVAESQGYVEQDYSALYEAIAPRQTS
ncbi:MAG: NAD(P)-dependent oxidoreductase [Chromatiaceae bacterium]|nr:NAD(P)-dependent oxidoreductase [Chromatiaceae bacterium]